MSAQGEQQGNQGHGHQQELPGGFFIPNSPPAAPTLRFCAHRLLPSNRVDDRGASLCDYCQLYALGIKTML